MITEKEINYDRDSSTAVWTVMVTDGTLVVFISSVKLGIIQQLDST